MQYTIVMAEKVIKFFIRVPEDVMSDLRHWADEDDRSVNSLIVHVLRRALREWRQAA